jgi:hypothetical protein
VADHVAFKPDTLAALRDGLWLVVNGSGTGARARIPGYDVAGKTGTAQVISNQGRQAAKGTDRDLRDHGFFVFFAPRDNPQIAGVIFGEHAEHGPLAAPIAKHVIETFFAKKEGRPLPLIPGQQPPVTNDEDPDSPPALPAVDVADARGVVYGTMSEAPPRTSQSGGSASLGRVQLPALRAGGENVTRSFQFHELKFSRDGRFRETD